MPDVESSTQLPPRPPQPTTAIASVLGRLRLPLRRYHANAGVRARLVLERAAVLERLRHLDRAILTLAQRRRALLAEVASIDDVIAPRTEFAGRRRPKPDAAARAPVAPDALPVAGARLREICRSLLQRHGERTLVDLHSLLHEHGYVIGHRHPVKHLADMLRYEVLAGRASTPRRATYRIVGSPDSPPALLPGYDGSIRYSGPSSDATYSSPSGPWPNPTIAFAPVAIGTACDGDAGSSALIPGTQ